MNIAFYFYCFLISFVTDCLANTFVVNTKYGPVKGSAVLIKEKNKTVTQFQGIPYAKPPIGDLRFKAAQPPNKWNGVLDATHARSPCMQPDQANISEDCLFINIFTPFDEFVNQTKKSVLFWIHGGAYVTGTIFDGSFNSTYLSILGDVVVVHVNYRLSAFGFLYDGTEESPGNQAFTDFLMALKFVKENIEYFGGDPHSVTIFGESAGSMAVSTLLMMKSEDLFKRAIMQSGAVNSFIGSESKESAKSKATNMAKEFSCYNNDSNKIEITCLRNINERQLVSYINKKKNGGEFFGPIFGDSLLPTKPSLALEKGEFQSHIDLLFGTCNDEGSGFLSGGIIPDLRADSANTSMTVAKAKFFIQMLFTGLRVPFAKEISEFYTKGLTDKDGINLKRAVGNAFGDFQIVCPSIIFGSDFSLKSNAYAYRLTYTTRNDWTGVRHGDDISYTFGGPLRNPNHSNDDQKQLSQMFIEIWTTFAKTGKPPSINGIQWVKAIDREIPNPSVRYMELNPKNYQIVNDAYKQTCDQFWKIHLKEISGSHQSFPFLR